MCKMSTKPNTQRYRLVFAMMILLAMVYGGDMDTFIIVKVRLSERVH